MSPWARRVKRREAVSDPIRTAFCHPKDAVR